MDDELELSPDSNDMLMIDEDCEGDAETDQSDLNMELLNDEVGGVFCEKNGRKCILRRYNVAEGNLRN